MFKLISSSNAFNNILKIPFNLEKKSNCLPSKNDKKNVSSPHKASALDIDHLQATFAMKKENNNKQAELIKTSFEPIVIIGMEREDVFATPYCSEKIEAAYDKLQALREKGVYFKFESIQKNKVMDGLCSAIAFSSLRYLFIHSDSSLSKKLRRISKTFKNGAPQELAILQSVFNSIHLNFGARGDIRHAKMQSLANAFDLRLDGSYPVIYWDKNLLAPTGFKEELDQQIHSLRNGAYCIRMLWNESNHKQEALGHSVVLVREDQNFYLLDSGRGFFPLGSDNVTESLIKILGSWGGGSDELRIYSVCLGDSSANIVKIKKYLSEKSKESPSIFLRVRAVAEMLFKGESPSLLRFLSPFARRLNALL